MTIIYPTYADENGIIIAPYGVIHSGEAYSTRREYFNGSFAESDGIIDFDCSGVSISYSTPHISDIEAGRLFGAKKIDSSDNIVTFTDPDGALFDGQASIQLTMQNEGIWFAHDGTQWRVRGHM